MWVMMLSPQPGEELDGRGVRVEWMVQAVVKMLLMRAERELRREGVSK